MAVAPSGAIQHTDEPNWESPHSHLGPFSGIIPSFPISSDPLRVSRDHVRQGSRVLEGIKIHGDENVPGGQRSFIAFLNDPLVPPEALQEAEETFLEVSPEGEDGLPWPFVSRAPTITERIDQAAYTQTYFSPERGIDFPGVMRLANVAFSFPQWTDCVVHVEYDSEIGFGGFGEVYLAMLDGSLKVAVKQLRIIQTKGIRARVAMRLARELKIWAKAKHPNVLKLVGYHLSENYDCAQLLSPYMQNGNIAEYMKRTEASMEARLGFVRGITLGMAHLHACDPPICHGDLKPANVLINDKPDAVLCDFGLAVFIEDSGASSGLTTSRSIKGSLRYMSPELLDDDEAKHTLESDIWAWACTIFEIITSVSPYTDLRTDRGIRAAVVRGVFPGSMELLEGFAPQLDNPYRSTLVALQALIPECWTTELGERPPSSSILNRLHYVDLGNSDLPPAQAPLDDKQTDDSAMVERVIADLSVLSKLQITGESDHVDTVPGISNRANFGNDRGALQAPSAIPPLPVHMPLGSYSGRTYLTLSPTN
ncbi:hypothetical protein M407DRAFT_20107 [Tulasnella calospora MUT 4182]|uniref:Protein kinase domain-containing protein n=1 Tax=Tulasnella calospora MUT 4182 TaxID=1051891 RepID=A0A0C3MAR7_9AGAM|nr:hypothetical protein M407DRAFT_20107 [Tulasnella calospora MUT 4182]